MTRYYISAFIAYMRRHANTHAAALLTGLIMTLVSTFSVAQHAYPSAEAAADAFVDAVASGDADALRTVLGADWKRFIPRQEIDRDDVYDFLSAWAKSHRLVASSPERT